MKVFACVNTAPDVVAKFLCQGLAVDQTDLHFVQKSVNRKRVQIFLDYKLFVKLHRTIKARDDLVIVVFGNPFQFYSWNMIPLDYAESDEPHQNAFEYRALDRKTLRTEGQPLKYEHRNYLEKIMKTVSAFDSLLHGLMSFMYSMKTPERKLAKEAACKFLYKNQSMEVLRRDLTGLNDRQIERMLTILGEDVAQRIQRAFSDPITNEERSTKYNVSAYELRFIEHNAKAVA